MKLVEWKEESAHYCATFKVNTRIEQGEYRTQKTAEPKKKK